MWAAWLHHSCRVGGPQRGQKWTKCRLIKRQQCSLSWEPLFKPPPTRFGGLLRHPPPPRAKVRPPKGPQPPRLHGLHTRKLKTRHQIDT